MEKEHKGRESTVEKVSPKSEGVSSLCIQAKRLFLSVWDYGVSPLSSNHVYIKLQLRKNAFSVFLGGGREKGNIGLKPQII